MCGTWGAVLGGAGLWWWAVLRLVLSPGAGALEGAIAAGGWGLSLLPVHCVPKARAVGALPEGRWGRAWRVSGEGGVSLSGGAAVSSGGGAAVSSGGGAAVSSDGVGQGMPDGTTRASSRRRSGGGSGPS
ncbi:hypothetical protein [Streptomyces sp. LBL]|uniref:hypothetical protein n=1 Tax=Streptomyces sp. LBL TaxID=2940562 RepID=UPI002475EE21|nr:hypothetical protein [Streptomyces sp. LBL]